MNKLCIYITSAIMVILFNGCTSVFEVDPKILQEKIYEPAAIKYESLQESTVLYLDHSTCVVDARQNSKIFNALRPQLGQYSDYLVLIKGSNFETTSLNRSDNKVFQVLQTIQQDIPYSDILKAVEQITKGNQQAILITDCEFIERGKGINGRDLYHDRDPYFSEPLKKWIAKGHSVDILIESYQEKYQGKIYDKKRFYFIFSDDKMDAPISHNMLGEIKSFLKNGLCSLYHLTNSDIFVRREGKNMVAEDLTFKVEEYNGFEFVSIDDSWNAIREYVMKLDQYGEPLPEEKPVPLIANLILNHGEDYTVEDMEIVATNITAKYLSMDTVAAENLKLDCNEIKSNDINMSEGFFLDKNALKNNILNIFLTEKIFNFLTDEYGGNLIRLDFVVTKVGLQDNFVSDMFEWKSLFDNDNAICVSKSIENVLRDVEIIPTNRDRRVVHTVFVKTESYKQ